MGPRGQRARVARIDVATAWEEDTALVTVKGELDAFTAEDLRAELKAVEAADPKRVVLDLSGVSFLDSSGLAVILGVRERAVDASSWELELVISGSGAVEETFAAIKADPLFSITSPPESGTEEAWEEPPTPERQHR